MQSKLFKIKKLDELFSCTAEAVCTELKSQKITYVKEYSPIMHTFKGHQIVIPLCKINDEEIPLTMPSFIRLDSHIRIINKNNKRFILFLINFNFNILDIRNNKPILHYKKEYRALKLELLDFMLMPCAFREGELLCPENETDFMEKYPEYAKLMNFENFQNYFKKLIEKNLEFKSNCEISPEKQIVVDFVTESLNMMTP